MAGAVGLKPDQIRMVTNNMETSIGNIKTHIQQIEDASDAARAGWKGDANGAFVKAQEAWHSEADTLKAKLDALHQATVEGSNRLLAMDQQNA
jgi:WXG100 family type VII secretion target